MYKNINIGQSLGTANYFVHLGHEVTMGEVKVGKENVSVILI